MLGSSVASIEAFAVADLCNGFEALQKQEAAGVMSAEDAEKEHRRLLAENHARWGRYSPCAEQKA